MFRNIYVFQFCMVLCNVIRLDIFKPKDIVYKGSPQFLLIISFYEPVPCCHPTDVGGHLGTVYSL